MENILRVKLIRKQDYKSMAWKNGLGTTNQIDIYPPGAPFPNDSFSWRISSANISASTSGSTSFSLFPDCERILVVWKGAGLLLNGSIVLEPLKPYAFSGEELMDCELIGEEDVVDFGIIYRRDRCDAVMGLCTFDAKAQGLSHINHLKLGKGTHYFLSVRGCFTLANSLVNNSDTLMIGVDTDEEEVKIEFDESRIQFFHVHVTYKDEDPWS